MASRGVNKVIVLGNLGKDPETRSFNNGGSVTNITVATSESWKDKQTGETQEKTEWHNIAIFGKLAEIAAQYLTKGSQVYIEGALQTRKWQDQNGQDRYTTEIVVQGFNGVLQMIGARQGGQQRQPAQQQGQQRQPAQQQGQQRQPAQQQGGQQSQQQSQQQGGYGQQKQGTQQQQGNLNQQPQQGFNEPTNDFDDDLPF